ncbi:41012_t:CDS:2, partial [Gigaspora margarita]
LLDQYEAKKDKKMNVLGAIRFIIQAWREVILETIHNCFQYTGILLDAQDNEESFIDDNDNKLIEYIDYPEEKDTNEVISDKEILDLTTNFEFENKSVKDDDTLNAVEILKHYIVQNDFSKTAQFEHNKALLKLQKEIRKLRIKAFKQTSIKTYFELVD